MVERGLSAVSSPTITARSYRVASMRSVLAVKRNRPLSSRVRRFSVLVRIRAWFGLAVPTGLLEATGFCRASVNPRGYIRERPELHPRGRETDIT